MALGVGVNGHSNVEQPHHTPEPEPEVGFAMLTRMAHSLVSLGPEDTMWRRPPRQQSSGGFEPFSWHGGGRHAAKRWLQLVETTTARDDINAVAGLTLPRIRQLETPASGIYGERSVCLPSGRGLRHAVPGFRLIVVPNGGHLPIR